MNFKKNLVVFAILICILFSISCVVASDVNDANVTTCENQAIDDSNEELLSSSQEDSISSSDDNLIAKSQEDLISSSGKGTFTELQKMINDAPNGALINLEKDYDYDIGFNSTKGIVITKNLLINGNGHTLDGLSKSRILFIVFGLTDNNKVILNNIVFKNGNNRFYGGAIFNYANLTVNKCVFENNYAGTTAGAICSVGSLICQDSNFNKNVANGDAGAIFSLNFENEVPYFNHYYLGYDGKDASRIDERGIISTLISDYTISPLMDYVSACKFSNNIAKGHGGGAVYAFSHMAVVSSVFTSNKASDVGGAVYGAKNLIIKGSKFTKNAVSLYGGAVYFKFHEITGHYDAEGNWIPDVKFYGNLIENCVFTENVAKDRGGAIYGFKFSKAPQVLGAHAVKCTFKDNWATSDGDEIYGGTLKNCVLKNTLTLKTVKVKKSAKKLVLTAKLKKGSKVLKYKKITFKFKNKIYKAKTNSKGIAKVTVESKVLKKLKVGSKVTYSASYSNKYINRKTVKVYK